MREIFFFRSCNVEVNQRATRKALKTDWKLKASIDVVHSERNQMTSKVMSSKVGQVENVDISNGRPKCQ